MPYYLTDYIADLDDQLAAFERANRALTGSETPPNREALEASKAITASATQLCCSMYENAVYAIMEEVLRRHNTSPTLLHYFGYSRNRHITYASWNSLCDFMKKFGHGVSKDFKNHVTDAERLAMINMTYSRDQLSHHNGYATLTKSLSEVISEHKKIKSLLRKFETRITRALR